jgi:hypothetical protein
MRGFTMLPTRRILLAFGLIAVIGIGAQTPNARAQDPGQAPVIVTLRGSSDGRAPAVLGPVPLHAGLVVLRVRHGGSSTFGVDLATAQPGRSPLTEYDFTRNLINTLAPYDGATATLLPTDGDYFVIVGATGTFALTLEQPLPDNVTPVEARSFSGDAGQVTPVFALPAGTYTIHVTSAATARLFAWLYRVDDLGGGVVFESADGRFLQETAGPFDRSVTLTLRRGGLFLISLEAGSYQPAHDPPTWSLAVE